MDIGDYIVATYVFGGGLVPIVIFCGIVIWFVW